METIEQAYNPYDFSSTRCYIIVVNPPERGIFKIEHKLPSYIKTLRGVFVSNTFPEHPRKNVGILSLNFNGHAFKSFQLPIPNISKQPEVSQPLELHEAIQPNSFLQGYFYGLRNPGGTFYKLSIYLHYDYER